MNKRDWSKVLPCAEALQAAIEAERLAEWDETGRNADHYRKVAERATADFLVKRLAHHRVSIH
jgi:hypothetical protein